MCEEGVTGWGGWIWGHGEAFASPPDSRGNHFWCQVGLLPHYSRAEGAALADPVGFESAEEDAGLKRMKRCP